MTDSKLEAVKRQIAAMASRTIDNGVNEAEASSAAAKIAELLAKYDLEMSDVEAAQAPTVTKSFWTGYKVQLPYTTTAVFLMELCDCMVWFTKDDEGVLVFKFFGLETDAKMAVYLLTLVHRAMHNEQDKFKNEAMYASLQSGSRRSALKSFQQGFTNRINRKIEAAIEQKVIEEETHIAYQRAAEGNVTHSSSTALILAKKRDRVRDEMSAKYGWTPKIVKRKRTVKNSMAFAAGQEAADKISLNRPLEEDISKTKRITASA